MKKSKEKILISIFVFFIILLLSISIILANNTFDKINIEINEEKISYEIKYFDSKIIYMANLLSNIENETDFFIEWEELEKQTYSLYNYWNSVILDLNYLNIDKVNLTDFGKYLDKLIVSIKYNNRKETLSNLVELYSKLTIYIKGINDNDYSNILLAKYNLLCAYYILENANWTMANDYILKASNYINKVVNSMEINQCLQFNINQTYVSVKELENIINIKNIDVFYFKYNIAINNLINLTY